MMKKILIVFVTLFLIASCQQDEMFSPIDVTEAVPNSLSIDDLMGIKVESTIVYDEVKMNVKLPYTGEYRIKIRDIGKKLISQEKIIANEGDNLLKVYVSSLPNDGYTLELTDINHKILGITTIIVNN
jgi:UDP-galactopyranose mutase